MLRGERPERGSMPATARGGYRTLIDMLRGAATRAPKRGVYVLDDRGNQSFRTYAQILEASLRVGAALQKRGIGRDERVLLVMPTSFEFLSAFFGVVSIGAVPVPSPPPPHATVGVSSDRAEAVLRMADRLQTPAALFCTAEDQGARPPQLGELKHVIDVGSLVESVPVDAEPTRTAPGEIAYIQATSGATGRRRAVELTHHNILSNVEGIGRKLQVTPKDVAVSWLPLHSSLGLVGVALTAVYWQLDVVLMHPDRFLRRPDEWLHCFARHGATLTAAPSFGYDYCVRRCRESHLRDLDLSNLRVALNGGEPASVDTMEAFTRRFAKFGFRPEAFTPVYGLTEATLAVSSSPPNERVKFDTISRRVLESDGVAEPRSIDVRLDRRLRFASVGTPLQHTDLMVIDHRGMEVEDRVLGEIAVRGPHVMHGYFDRPKKRSDGGTRVSGEWLMTGDLGYVAAGELYVVARNVATVDRDTQRLFNEPIEDVVQRVDGVRAGSPVLFTTGGNLVLAVETQAGSDEDEITAMIRSVLMRNFRLEPDVILCVSPQSIPRSATGKTRRHLVQQFYEAGLLDRRQRTAEFDGVRRVLQRTRHQAIKFGQSLLEQARGLWTKDD